MTFEFSLASFEFNVPYTAPVASRDRRFIIVALSPNKACERLLCDLEGQLLIVDDSFVNELVGISTHYLGALRFVSPDVDPENSINSDQIFPELIDFWVRVIPAEQTLSSSQWLGLRSQLTRWTEDWFALAGRALQIAQWFFDHQYCGRCGKPTLDDKIDRARVCNTCDLRFYPRISPCMIVLVTRGEELLLAYHRRSTRQVYTTLAGFVEAGESVEACIRREVAEEVGVKLGDLEYFRSQPWAFPGQLMLGFFATYESGELNPDGAEISEANWFRYDQLPEVPSTATVSGQLIAEYVARIQKNSQ